MLRPSNANSVLFPPANSQKGNQSKGKENQPTKTVSTSNQSKESEVKDAGMLWERKVLIRPNKKIPVFRVTRPYLNLLAKPRIISNPDFF